MTLRRCLLLLLSLIVMLSMAGGLYTLAAWETWRKANGISNLEWRWGDVSLAGLRLDRLSATQSREGQRYHMVGKQLSLAWRWHGPMPEAIVIEQLALTLPQGVHAEGDLTISKPLEPGERQLTTSAMKIEGRLAERALAGWTMGEGRINLTVSGTASEQAATLTLGEQSRVEFDDIAAPGKDSRLDGLWVNLAGVTLVGEYQLAPMALERLAVEGPFEATVATIHHPQLLPQPWRFDGQLDGTLGELKVDGRLSSDAGVDADMDMNYPFEGVPALEVSMDAAGASGGRALADTFTAWPAALEVSDGRVEAALSARFPSQGFRVQGDLVFDNLDGLYDRTAWTGLDGRVNLNLDNDHVNVRTSDLVLDALNPGIALRDVRVAGLYRSPRDQIANGTLVLDQASSELLGGEVRVTPGEWQLADMPLRISLELSGIELAKLMQLYPAEGLAGSGLLQGAIPVRVGPEGVSIDAGQVQAVAPGGTLKLPADRLKGMAQGNQAMALVVQAMENFHYSVLNSTIDYAQDGTLMLGLRLEGSSPEVRDGHPIVLNINLEEDIPALLTSLQLSGRVNDAVTEKVRNLIRERDAQRQSTGAGNNQE
ncbi:YdbH domain-containing protein [Marinobacter salarius]|uniref:YdbH domain-containing protein n=1 Tax=Marinobacter salarius TaxID=1420917 RepID=UPI00132F7D31|nr:YdbH domain-containing protein [Marinobacter salarius]